MKELLKAIIDNGYKSVTIENQVDHLLIKVKKDFKRVGYNTIMVVEQKFTKQVVEKVDDFTFTSITKDILSGIRKGFEEITHKLEDHCKLGDHYKIINNHKQ